jgi:hypothetical protein
LQLIRLVLPLVLALVGAPLQAAADPAPVASIPPRPGTPLSMSPAGQEARRVERRNTLIGGFVLGGLVMLGGFALGHRIRTRKLRD